MSTTTKKIWSYSDVQAIYAQPLLDLLYAAHTTHRQHQPNNQIQAATLLSIKTGACPEDCKYCSQSGHYNTGIKTEKLLSLDKVLAAAQAAKANGATRFCMGAAWRQPPVSQRPQLVAMIKAVKALGLETCMTLGMLRQEDAIALKDAGLDYYNHNLDTSAEYYERIVSTRSYQDRLDTIAQVKSAGIKVCCGGILGLGENRADRINLLLTLANLDPPPESVPINQFMPVQGTPLADTPPIDGIELVRTVATARITMPSSMVRLTAGRTEMSEELQAMCFFAGANSVFIGEVLLTEPNPQFDQDQQFFAKLGLTFESATV